MSKFVIECPSCGKYTEASNSFFAKKHIDCTCGYTIHVKTDKMTSRVCPHCGNNVIFDQSKGDKALCPVCKEKINTADSIFNKIEFKCPSCSCALSADKNAKQYTCPLCDTVIDVQEQAAKESIRDKGLASVIKYEGDNTTFVWKHPIEDFNLGSQLIVHESQEALFFRDGEALDLFVAGRYTLATQNLPLLEKLYQLPTNADTIFHSEIYFINKTVQMAIKWGTPDKVKFIDPITGVPLEIGVSGEMNIQVSDSRKLILKLVGTKQGIAWEDKNGFTKSLQNSFRPMIANSVKVNLSNIIKSENIDLLEIDSRLDIISECLRKNISSGFEDFGLTIPSFYVTNVALPEDDPNFKRIRELHTIELQKRVYQAEADIKKTQIQTEADVKVTQAQSETQFRTAQEQSKAAIEAEHRKAELERQTTETEIARMEAERRLIAAQAEAQSARMAGMAEADVMAAKGYNQKDIIQAEVQKSYAESIGNMGPAISSGGGGGTGIVNDMLNLSVGIAAANAISPQIGNMMQGFGNFDQSVRPDTPTQNTWDCSCGQKGITGNFCSNCGAKKPAPAETWDCPCGQKGITGNFCNNCGAKKPAPAETWDCSCGQKGITGNFCNNCGAKRPAPAETWDCSCGQKGITGNFCNNCGKKKD